MPIFTAICDNKGTRTDYVSACSQLCTSAEVDITYRELLPKYVTIYLSDCGSHSRPMYHLPRTV